MIEIIKAYPIIFLFTVILPVLGGMVGGYIGWDSLKSRYKDDIHKQQVQESLTAIDSKLKPISNQIAIIQRYETELAKHNQKDEILTAVLAQYKKMKQATVQFHKFRGIENEEEKGKLAEHILTTITESVAHVVEAPNLPNRPLIIDLGSNIFKVVFSVPMRIPPKLAFQGLPEGVSWNITENSKFGFTVQFQPIDTLVKGFGFTADAEL